MSILNARKSRTVIPAGSAYAGYEYKVKTRRVNPCGNSIGHGRPSSLPSSSSQAAANPGARNFIGGCVAGIFSAAPAGTSPPISRTARRWKSLRRWRGIACIGVAAALFLLLLTAELRAKDYSLYGRDVGCSEVAPGRLRQICEAIAASLTWQWMGHAIIAPGYKPSFGGIIKVYCNLKIGKDDIEPLRILKSYDAKRKWFPDWRLESGADMLLRIVINLNGMGDEPMNSIFNPKSPDYILKNGCS